MTVGRIKRWEGICLLILHFIHPTFDLWSSLELTDHFAT